MTTTRHATLALLVCAGALAGCGGESATPTVARTTPAADVRAAETASRGDRTRDLTAANPGAGWLSAVSEAIETEPGRIEVSTTIVDPRGADGSAAARRALAICRAAQQLLVRGGVTSPHVSVLERDGSTFVLYGHPMVPKGECGEV